MSVNRVMLAGRVAAAAAEVAALRRVPLAQKVDRLGRPRRVRRRGVEPARAAHAVRRLLDPAGARCLTQALVLFRLMRSDGFDAELVVGLPHDAISHRAHAWVELHGKDLGPLPGRSRHRELVRYPLTTLITTPNRTA